jgi:hypothetical protein
LGVSVAIFEFGCQKAELGRGPSRFRKIFKAAMAETENRSGEDCPSSRAVHEGHLPHIPYPILPHILRLKTSLKQKTSTLLHELILQS